VKRLALAVGLALVALVAVLALRAATQRSDQVQVPAAAPLDLDPRVISLRLALALRIETVSPEDPDDFDPRAFRRLRSYLRRMYPRTHEVLEWETVGDWSLLYTWEGSNPQLAPILLAAHLDVVPVDPTTLDEWTHPPFGGMVEGDVVWGRGALDDKAAVIAILEAVERLVRERFTPERTVHLAFGHDEEVGGMNGARAIARVLEERDVELAFALDEGGVVVSDYLPGLVAGQVALVGIAEKGSAAVGLELVAEGGHSSAPGRRTAIGELARAVVRLEDHPMPAAIDGVTAEFLDQLAPQLGFLPRLVLANRWLFGPLLSRYFETIPPLDAMQRTTTAVTIFEAGLKENVLPTRARAVVNYRIHPRDSINTVSKHVRDTIDDDRIRIAVGVRDPPRNPSPVSPVGTDAWRALASAIRASFPEAAVIPYLSIGGTDGRHYHRVTDSVYRFTPLVQGPESLALVHGIDERVSVENLVGAVGFYFHLLQSVAGADGAALP
jgi:carboxypeptidase PM20D1